MIVSAMRAGYSFQAAMKLVGEEVTDPLGPEFLRFYEEQRLGVEVRVRHCSSILQRTPDLDLRMFVTAVLIQRETGGNLTEVLERLSTLMREREGFRGDLETHDRRVASCRHASLVRCRLWCSRQSFR